MPRLLPLLCLAACASAWLPARAGSVDVLVTDAAGEPLEGAAIFLESP